MGTESGVAVTLEFKELFDELGLPDGQVTLIKVVRGASVFAEPPPPIELDCGNPILDDPADRQAYQLVSFDRRIFRIWGGNLAPDEPTFADGLVAEANLQMGMLPGGGIRYGGQVLPIKDYYRGFAVENSVTQWYVVTEGIRLVE